MTQLPGNDHRHPDLECLRRVEFESHILNVAVNSDYAYVITANEIVCIELIRFEVRWRTKIRFEGRSAAIAAGEGLVCACFDQPNRFYGWTDPVVQLIDESSGKVRRKKRVARLSRPKFIDGLLHITWSRDRYVAINPRSLRVVANLGQQKGYSESKESSEVDHAEGDRTWKSRALTGLTPVGSNQGTLFARWGRVLYAFGLGAEPRLPSEPAERLELAKGLVGRVGTLTPFEFQQLGELAPESVAPMAEALVPSFQSWCEALKEYRTLPCWEQNGQGRELLASLEKVIRADDIKVLIHAYDRMHPEEFTRLTFLDIIMAKGEPSEVIPFLQEQIRESFVAKRRFLGEEIQRRGFEYLADEGKDSEKFLIDMFREEPRSRPLLYPVLARAGANAAAALIAFRKERGVVPAHWPDLDRDAESDREKAIEAAFDCMTRYRSDQPAEVAYPSGFVPFRMSGTNGICYTKGNKHESGKVDEFILVHCPEDEPAPEPDSDSGEIVLEYVTYHGPLAAAGYHVWLRKFGDEWAPVRTQLRWRA